MTSSGTMHIKITNVCSKIHLNRNVLLSDIVNFFPDACSVGQKKTGPIKFKSIQIKLSQFSGNAMVSLNGVIIIVGSDSIESAQEFALFLFTVLGGNRPAKFSVSNIASTVYTPFKIQLDKFFVYTRGEVDDKSNITYEPERCNCVQVKSIYGLAKIYSTGNMVITGSRSEKDSLETMKLALIFIDDYYRYVY